ncbi:hypothetical protein BCPG_04931 [Burkholderia cenocepacia PC184]|nr:hypothetical protein BCPG_04931 [Burkholderia cenocepacia PC184]
MPALRCIPITRWTRAACCARRISRCTAPSVRGRDRGSWRRALQGRFELDRLAPRARPRRRLKEAPAGRARWKGRQNEPLVSCEHGADVRRERAAAVHAAGGLPDAAAASSGADADAGDGAEVGRVPGDWTGIRIRVDRADPVRFRPLQPQAGCAADRGTDRADVAVGGDQRGARVRVLG